MQKGTFRWRTFVKGKKIKSVHSSLSDRTSTDDWTSIQLQILHELKKINLKLEAVEDQIVEAGSKMSDKIQ